MKSVYAAILVLMAGGFAHADMIQPATLDLTCSPAAGAQGSVIQIVSDSSGSSVTIDGKTFEGTQLIGGTEGGAPELQAVHNSGGYNITIRGGDFEAAFYGNKTIENGEAGASVDLFSKGQRYNALCQGKFGF